jgi:hypothetical protein
MTGTSSGIDIRSRSWKYPILPLADVKMSRIPAIMAKRDETLSLIESP